MQIHIGRLIDHVHLITQHFDATKRFYREILGSLGRTIDGETENAFWCDELYVGTAEAVTMGQTHVHLAFQTPDRETVDRFHRAALAAGGRDHGKPGVRDQYHPGYYGAFVLDPDGHNVEVVNHNRP